MSRAGPSHSPHGRNVDRWLAEQPVIPLSRLLASSAFAVARAGILLRGLMSGGSSGGLLACFLVVEVLVVGLLHQTAKACVLPRGSPLLHGWRKGSLVACYGTVTILALVLLWALGVAAADLTAALDWLARAGDRPGVPRAAIGVGIYLLLTVVEIGYEAFAWDPESGELFTVLAAQAGFRLALLLVGVGLAIPLALLLRDPDLVRLTWALLLVGAQLGACLLVLWLPRLPPKAKR